MMPWEFVGSTRLEHARKLLPSVWSDWHSNWCFKVDGLANEPVLIDAASAEDMAQANWLCAEMPEGKVWLGYESESDWHRQLFGGIDQAPHDALTASLIEQARLALVNSMLVAIGLEKVTSLTLHSQTTPEYMCPRVIMRVTGHAICVCLDASLFNTFLPLPVQQKPLVRREEAIGSARVSLRVHLSLSKVPVAALSQLQLGDVLPTTMSLSQRFQLVLPKGVQASGYLLRKNSQRVLQLADH
ncbi:MAG: hypothetical protein U0998_00480 [Moraxellaceae bacterium]|nr:hypothetical protein [Moraxellaceae bacterium]MDZ4298821.1 hypothetical protein [Moraxellaceae bacterium]MDZ4385676.1 hypothetical protein [Moraxellaceae bacterium]